MAKIIDFLSRADRENAGCGFLAADEVEAWIEGGLVAERRAEFASHQVAGCSPCTLLAADVQSFLAVDQNGAIEIERTEFEASAADVRDRLTENLAARGTKRAGRPSRGKRWTWISGVAAAAVLVTVLIVPRLSTDRDRRDGVIPLPWGGDYSIAIDLPFSAPPSVRDAQTLSGLWRDAGAAHEAGRYEESARLFAQIAERDPASHDAALYHGYSLLQTGRYVEAVASLQRALKLADEQGLVGASDSLYLGLAAIGQRDLELARRSLERARTLGGPYGNEAAVLLREIAAK